MYKVATSILHAPSFLKPRRRWPGVFLCTNSRALKDERPLVSGGQWSLSPRSTYLTPQLKEGGVGVFKGVFCLSAFESGRLFNKRQNLIVRKRAFARPNVKCFWYKYISGSLYTCLYTPLEGVTSVDISCRLTQRGAYRV